MTRLGGGAEERLRAVTKSIMKFIEAKHPKETIGVIVTALVGVAAEIDAMSEPDNKHSKQFLDTLEKQIDAWRKEKLQEGVT